MVSQRIRPMIQRVLLIGRYAALSVIRCHHRPAVNAKIYQNTDFQRAGSLERLISFQVLVDFANVNFEMDCIDPDRLKHLVHFQMRDGRAISRCSTE